MNTPCQDRIEMAVRGRARSMLRRWFAGPNALFRPTAEEAAWLRHNLPETSTDSALERALMLAGPAFHKASSHYVSEYWLPSGNASRLTEFILAALAEEDASHA